MKFDRSRQDQSLEDSSEDDAGDHIDSILLELLPTYYKYQEYLASILNADGRADMLPTQQKQQLDKAARQSKLDEWKEIIGNKKSSNERRRNRINLTENLIERHRKKQRQEYELMLKYEAREIRQIMGEVDNESEQNAGSRHRQQQGLPRKEELSPYFPNSRPNLQYQYPIHPHNEQDNLTRNRVTFAQNNSHQNAANIYKASISKQLIFTAEQLATQPYIVFPSGQIRPYIQPEPNQNNESMPKNTHKGNLLNHLNINLGSRNHHYDLDYCEQEKEDEDEEQINFQEEDHESGRGRGRKTSQNMVRVEYDQTHSETHHQKTIQRHSTPNFQTYSQKGRHNPYFDLQRQKIDRQKRQAQLLHREVSHALGEDVIDDLVQSSQEPMTKYSSQEPMTKNSTAKDSNVFMEMMNSNAKTLDMKDSIFAQPNQNEDESTNSKEGLRFLIEELCELWSICQYFKYQLKNKQYSILSKLCGDEIGTGDISLKLLQQGALKILKEEEKHVVMGIIGKLFGKEDQISYQDFGASLKSKLNQAEVRYIDVKVAPINPHEVLESLGRLFSVLAEIIYFEEKAKDLAIKNPKQLTQLKQSVEDPENPNSISVGKVESFIYKTSGNRTNRLRISLFFKNNIKSFTVHQFIEWLSLNSLRHTNIVSFMFNR